MSLVNIKSIMINNLFRLLIILVCALCAFPLFWMLIVSLKSGVLILDPSVWFFTPTLENYQDAFFYRNILDYIKNSFIVVVITTFFSILIGGMAAYGFARFNFKKREDTAFWILSLRMLPPLATVIPFFVMAHLLKVLDTHIVLIICYMLFNIPFTIWMMRGFFEEIPEEIEEAAFIDGCSRFQVFIKIVLPLAIPGLIATGIFCIINSWNEFVFALFLTSSDAITLPTTVTLFLSISGVAWGEMSAVGVITVIPVLIFAMLVQKYMIRGLTFGGVK
ncbi:carbohydrate ABC transporter membrane protein 2 (CUT1 family) [Pseudogracilibacillus auburnensis]|uniref:Carbohydrate ABC transporter membrane protein 2 (CUT1 family) n=1 Tax=Pseudogracilibacillus auburnensis TaxID=1494959 RepID=A0A2V3W8D3_9BACI|nr:carbohydrate ABC transporter permease [Pseudogracilibacillus auburnensis]PXW89424.1 carbohydrate ABC transporter membrane protein 2 (CUT1 family) [Pseudogracilibacillus auburnensis]